jgi:AraC-like DNA-binding protein
MSVIAGAVPGSEFRNGPGPWLRYALPADELKPFVTTISFFEVHPEPGAPFDELYWPRWTNLHFTLAGRWTVEVAGSRFDPVPEAAVFGVTTHATRVTSDVGSLVIGAGVTPLGWARLLSRLDASDYADRVADLGPIIGPAARHLPQRLRRAGGREGWTATMNEFLGDWLAATPDVAPEVADIHRLLIDDESRTVEEVAKRLGLSTRHVARIVRRVFGMPPKLLMRRTRFLRTLVALAPSGGRDPAATLSDGYHDWSHFIRDCRRFLGMTPTEFFDRPHSLLKQAIEQRTKVTGTPLQALHQPTG